MDRTTKIQKERYSLNRTPPKKKRLNGTDKCQKETDCVWDKNKVRKKDTVRIGHRKRRD